MDRRVAIVGTAPSYTKTPWADPGLEIWSLNDAYQLKGWQRADRWYDLHPLESFHFSKPDKPTFAHEVPANTYLRPAHHMEWLGKLSIPLYLQADPPAGWLHAKRFPREEIEAKWGKYEASTPVWMLLHAMHEDVREIHMYGIHLATEWEYLRQRPNMEAFIGAYLGRGPWSAEVKDGLRWYRSDGHAFVLPVESPIFQSDYQYAYQPKPGPHLAPLQWEMHKVNVKMNRVVQAMRTKKWHQPMHPLQEQLWRLEAWKFDVQRQMDRLSAGG